MTSSQQADIRKTVMRLHPDALAAVRKQAGMSLSINANTTPQEAGFHLGMARVLDILREGFTIEPHNPNTNDG